MSTLKVDEKVFVTTAIMGTFKDAIHDLVDTGEV